MRNEIVVGLDDSPSGKAALDWAAQQARSTGAVLRAVHALDWPYGLSSAGFPSPMDVTNVTMEEIQESYRQAITAVFDAASPDSDWIMQFATGDAGPVLVRQSKDARLLVVGTREHVGLGRVLTSSVSHYCLSRAVCQVVAVPAPLPERPSGDEESGPSGTTAPTDNGVVRQSGSAGERAEEPNTPDRTLVVGVDGSAESLAAARYAVAAAEMRGGDIFLVHAFPAPSARAGDRETALVAARTKAEELPAAVAAHLVVPTGVKVHTKAEPGDPVAVLGGSARQAAMLVLGRDRLSWGERLLIGAVASQVASHVACPLVVVPGGWRARQAVPRQPVVVALDGETAAEPASRWRLRKQGCVTPDWLCYTLSPSAPPLMRCPLRDSTLVLCCRGGSRTTQTLQFRPRLSRGIPTLSSYGGRRLQPSWSSAAPTSIAGDHGPGRWPAL